MQEESAKRRPVRHSVKKHIAMLEIAARNERRRADKTIATNKRWRQANGHLRAEIRRLRRQLQHTEAGQNEQLQAENRRLRKELASWSARVR